MCSIRRHSSQVASQAQPCSDMARLKLEQTKYIYRYIYWSKTIYISIYYLYSIHIDTFVHLPTPFHSRNLKCRFYFVKLFFVFFFLTVIFYFFSFFCYNLNYRNKVFKSNHFEVLVVGKITITLSTVVRRFPNRWHSPH